MTQPPTNDPDGRLFDDIYAQLRGKDPATVPWTNAEPHPLFASWLRGETKRGLVIGGQRALVIGSGLGDDANALAALGYAVTAFDYSPHAIDWARQRFPDAQVDWHVADLFALPESWRREFDLVVEVYTIQALPVTRRQDTIRAITDTVAPGGSLVMVALTRDVRDPLRARPWPLTEQEVASIERHGVVETDRVVEPPRAAGQPGRVRAVFHRNA